jgi:hypothetical protein
LLERPETLTEGTQCCGIEVAVVRESPPQRGNEEEITLTLHLTNPNGSSLGPQWSVARLVDFNQVHPARQRFERM